MSELPESLRRIFGALDGYLFDPEPDLEGVRALGPTPSDEHRFAVYRRLAQNNPRKVIRAAYKASIVLARRHDPELFERLIDRHLERNPARGWRLQAMSQGMSETLAEMEHPPGLDEIVDFEELLHDINHANLGAEQPGALSPTASVRTYTYQVPKLAREVRRALKSGGRGDDVEPEAGETTVVVYRNPHTGKQAWLYPDTTQLVAVAIASGEADASVLPELGLTPADLEAAQAKLTELGVIVPERSPS